MRLADSTRVWPRSTKKSRKARRSSSAVVGGTQSAYRPDLLAQLALRDTRRARISAARSSSAVLRWRSRSAAAGGRYRSTERRSVRVAWIVTPTPSQKPTVSQNSRLTMSRPSGRAATAVPVVCLLALRFAARPPALEELAELGFMTLRARSVVDAGLDVVGPVLLGHPPRRRVVRVHVTLPVAELAGARVTGVSQVDGNRAGGSVAHVLDCGADPRDHGVRLGREREVDDGLGEIEARLGHSDELDGAGGGVGDEQRLRVGHADVLRGEDDEAAGDQARVLPRFEHAGEPVQPGVGI